MSFSLFISGRPVPQLSAFRPLLKRGPLAATTAAPPSAPSVDLSYLHHAPGLSHGHNADFTAHAALPTDGRGAVAGRAAMLLNNSSEQQLPLYLRGRRQQQQPEPPQYLAFEGEVYLRFGSVRELERDGRLHGVQVKTL